MDSNRFDDLTRALARGISRRQALKLLGGSVAGGLLALLGVGEAAANKPGCKRNGKNCRRDDQCCSGSVCQSGQCCLPIGATFPFNCGPGCCGGPTTACCSGSSIENNGIFCTCAPPF